MNELILSSDDPEGVGDHQDARVSAGDIVLLGLNIVVPLINTEFLKVRKVECSGILERVNTATSICIFHT